ncbi:ankyrin, partial [Trichoderma longibrachiatum ATCC 18648]
MKLDTIPPELLTTIADFLPQHRDTNALARCSSRFHAIINPQLYRQNARSSRSDALAWAARTGTMATVKIALAYGADPNASQQRGEFSALRWAVAQGHRDIAQLLIDHGASLKDSMLMVTAARHTSDDIVRLLLDNGADINALGYLGKTPLLFAAQEGNESTFDLLLTRGA